ncbi:MAG TPA: DMT family transporter [Terriglobia bacterium]|nr:DMT family transporter [Terriglobia bacterium]
MDMADHRQSPSSSITPLFRYVVGPIALLAMGLGWSGSYTLAKIATMQGGRPVGIAIWEGLGSGLLLLLVCAGTGKWPRVKRRHLVYYTVNGLIGLTLPSVLLLYVAPHLPVSITTLLIPLAPLVTYLFVLALRVERFVALRALGVMLGFAGVLMVVLPENSLPDRSLVGWVLVGLIASVLYAMQNVYISLKSPPDADALTQTAAMLSIGGAIMLPYALASGDFLSPFAPWSTITFCAAGMATINAFFTICFVWLIHRTSAVFASQTAYTITLCGTVWGYLIFGERHNLWIWGAIAALVLGVALVTLVQGRRGSDQRLLEQRAR